MKVFISWSGKRSKETAECLSSWIRQVIQAADTWISLDIEKGIRWSDQIKDELEQSKIGIICLTKDNLQSEWILFEAGALSKTNDAHVCTFLLDIKPTDIKPPLGQFQHTVFNKEDVRKLIHTINNKIIKVGEKTIPEKDLNEVFEVFFPLLNDKLSSIKTEVPNDGRINRTDREILEEILQTIRASQQTENLKTLELISELHMRNRRELQDWVSLLNNNASSNSKKVPYSPEDDEELKKLIQDWLNKNKESKDLPLTAIN